MATIEKELEKLFCYTLEKDVIELKDVEAITTEQISNKIFEMIDASATHRQNRAMELYYDLLALKEPPMRILYLITRQFQMLLSVKTMGNQGFEVSEISSKLGLRNWMTQKYKLQAKEFSLETIKQALKDRDMLLDYCYGRALCGAVR